MVVRLAEPQRVQSTLEIAVEQLRLTKQKNCELSFPGSKRNLLTTMVIILAILGVILAIGTVVQIWPLESARRH